MNYKKINLPRVTLNLHFVDDIAVDAPSLIVGPGSKATEITSPYLMPLYLGDFRRGFSSIEVLEENIETFHLSLVFPAFCPLIEVFNEKIHQLLASGMVSHWHDCLLNPTGMKKKPDEIRPQVLTMEHLEVGFLVCFCPFILSIFTFVCELAFYLHVS